MSWAGLLLAVPAAPIALALGAAAPGVRPALPYLLPLAPIPALAVAIFAPVGIDAPLPDVLLGAGLSLDPVRRVFLGSTALLWSLAGLYALGSMERRRRRGFDMFWLATLGGNLGAFLAADVVSFYLAFSLLSLAAYGLIVHEASAEARRAARIYILLAIIGETALLAGLMIGAAVAESVVISDVRRVLPTAAWGDLGLWLLVVGFGLKLGMAPLHFWLPLAHPAAPTPASAILSGAIVKVGVFGLLTFMPMNAAAPIWSGGLLIAGFTTAFAGVLLGLPQARPKTVLAYSTISQMGLLVAVLGAASAGGAGEVDGAAALFVAHHVFAKGALFLAVGLAPLAHGRAKRLLLIVAGAAALALAGLPVTGGAVAKLALKGPLGDTIASQFVTASAVGTTLLMLRFLDLLTSMRAPAPPHPSPKLMAISFVAAVVAALSVPWLLHVALLERPWSYPLSVSNLRSAAWPLLAGFAVWTLARRLRVPHIRIPEGDLVVPAERVCAEVARRWRARAWRFPRLRVQSPNRALQQVLDDAEAGFASWPVASGALLAAILAAFGLLAAA